MGLVYLLKHLKNEEAVCFTSYIFRYNHEFQRKMSRCINFYMWKYDLHANT